MICSGNTGRQVKTISDVIQEEFKKRGILPLGKEGETEARWILLDYGEVVIHILTAEEREYYQLERLWKDAPIVDWDEEKSEVPLDYAPFDRAQDRRGKRSPKSDVR